MISTRRRWAVVVAGRGVGRYWTVLFQRLECVDGQRRSLVSLLVRCMMNSVSIFQKKNQYILIISSANDVPPPKLEPFHSHGKASTKKKTR